VSETTPAESLYKSNSGVPPPASIPTAKLKLFQTLDVDKGLVSFGNKSVLAKAVGKSLYGSVHALGTVSHEFF